MLPKGIWNYKGVSSHNHGFDEFDRANEDLAVKPVGFIKRSFAALIGKLLNERLIGEDAAIYIRKLYYIS